MQPVFIKTPFLYQSAIKKRLTLASGISQNKWNRRSSVHCLFPAFVLFLFVMGCRSTLQTNSSFSLQAAALPGGKAMPLALGEGYSCILNKKGQGKCLGSELKNPPAPSGWQVLRAAGSVPMLRNLVARATVTCAVGVKPPSLENRVMCWQPQSARTPQRLELDAILLSGKMPSPIRSLALQKDKVCALFADGQVGCGDLSVDGRALTIHLVKGLRFVRHVRSAENFSCAVRGDTGAIFCWGDNSAGQLGLGSPLQSEGDPVAIADFSGFATAVETGTQHACAINSAGEVLCWGMNEDQQLGVLGDKSLKPEVVRGLPAKAASLALGARHSCAQLVDGSVFCWGQREALGSDTQGGWIPVRVPLPVASSQILASPDQTCSQLTTGEFFCWGSEPEVLPVPQ
jgi:hypothetical protein